MILLAFYKYFYNYKITRGYTVVSLILVLSIIGILGVMVVPKISILKAKGQQSEARIQLMKIYNSMYTHKIENGFFPDTKGQILLITDFRGLSNYLHIDDIHFYSKGDKIYILSTSEQFVLAYVRSLANNNLDVQRLNSKKVFCHMLNGLKQGTENCNKEQIMSAQNNINNIKILKILNED